MCQQYRKNVYKGPESFLLFQKKKPEKKITLKKQIKEQIQETKF